MSEFRTSMEDNNRKTNEKLEKKLEDINEKLDNKLDDINTEIRIIKDTINVNEENSNDVLRRMDGRLTLLEEEMKKSSMLKQRRDELKRKEEENLAAQRLEEQNREKMPDKVNEILPPLRRKSFDRRVINQEDLTNELPEEDNTNNCFQGLPGRTKWKKNL